MPNQSTINTKLNLRYRKYFIANTFHIQHIYFQIAGVLGVCCVIILTSLALWRFHKTADWRVLAAAAVVTAVTMVVSFLLPWLVLKRNIKAAKAITVETAMQNIPTAIAFVVVSYTGPVLGEILPSLIFAGLGGFECVLALILYRILQVRSKRKVFTIQHDDGDGKSHAVTP